MSLLHYMLLPYLLEGSINDVSRPTIYDQHFGLGLSDFSMPLRSGYLRPWRFSPAEESGLSHVINDKDSFKVNLDVQQFKPEELGVKVVDRFLVVEGKHEERGDEHGYISRQFIRRYRLPDDVDENAISSTLSSDGVLQLTALKKPTEESENERKIPITQTNQPVKQIKEKEKREEKTESKTEQKQTGDDKKQENPPK